MIKHLSRKEIEDKKWNNCIVFAPNGFPYGYTWYLDNLVENWDGLVYGDYEMVFPLVWKSKFGIDYLYQPFFAQQLGLFSKIPLNKVSIHAFLNAIPNNFKYIDIQVNFLNYAPHPDFEFTAKTNLQLNLSDIYDNIKKGYNDNLKRNLKRAEKSGLKLSNNVKVETLVSFFRENTGNKLPEIKEQHYHALHRIIYNSLHHNVGITYGVLNKEDKLVSVMFLLLSPTRIINLLPSTSAEGKELRASPYLIDFIIRANAGKNIVLDFEGSMIPSVARFYKSFGANEVEYWSLKRNTLPWYLKWLK